MVKESAKVISTAGAIVADALLSPTTIVDSMIRLNRSDDVQLRKAIKIFCRHVLRVLDSQSAITVTVSSYEFVK